MGAEDTPEERNVGAEAANPSRRPRWRGFRGRRWLVATGGLLLAGLVSVAIWEALSSSPAADSTVLVGRTGRPAPAFSLPSLSEPSRTFSLRTFRGKALLVNFWASWCVPCRTEMPLLEKAYRAEGGKVAFLGIDINDTSSAAQAFLAQVHVTYPVVSAGSSAVAAEYGLYGLPTTVFISPTGDIVGRHIGELHADTLGTALEEAFPHP